MGSHQENWFYNQLSKSAQRGATWRVVGNQIVFSHIIEASGESGDNWNVSPPSSPSSESMEWLFYREVFSSPEDA